MDRNNLATIENTIEMPKKRANQTAKVINMQTHIKTETKQKHIMYTFAKRVIDIHGSLVGIILLITSTMAIYIATKFSKDSKGPLFYTQLRYGKDGKEFKLYKYRSMCVDADKRLKEYLEENEEAKKEYKKYKKLKYDPRITKVGKMLRKTSLDEFPQFLNVLKGEMSLVGPRPYLPREKRDMGDTYEKIITVKPGITGYWQVNGRNDVDFNDRIHMDTYYIEHRNFVMDIKIIIKTILKIFKKEGAI